MKPWKFIVTLVALLLFVAPMVRAQESTGAAAEASDFKDEVAAAEKRLEEVRAELENLLQLEDADLTAREAERQLLERLQVLLQDRREADTRANNRSADSTGQNLDLDTFFDTFADHGPPFSLSEYDGLLDRREAATSSRQLLQEEITFEERALEDRQNELQERERERRRIKEEVERALALEKLALQRSLRLAELRAEIGRERVAAQRARLRQARQELEEQNATEQLLQQAALQVREQIEVTVSDEEQQLAQIDEQTSALQNELRQARERLNQAESELQKFRARAERDDASGTAPTWNAERVALQEWVKSARLRLSLLNHRLESLPLRREQLEFRYQMWREGQERAALKDQRNRLRLQRDDLEKRVQRRSGELEQVQVEQQAIRAELDLLREATDSGLTPWLRDRSDALDQRTQILREEILLLANERRFTARFFNELEDRLDHVSLGERLQVLWTQAKAVWSFEIFAVQDNPITLGKILGSLLLLILGTALARQVSGLLADRVFTRLGLEPSVIAALQTLSLYAFLIAVFLLALWLVNIPLTVFTFLGGALAIGVGFGSQNIVNNFISGLIMMIERPVKVGDLIQVNETTGLVQKIGARSTHILAGDNTHLIVPNSSFLESNVLNWTHSNNLLRSAIDVGVAYGSPTDRVAAMLLQAAADVPQVETHPEPEVLFLDFGDSALLFRLLFWTRIGRPADIMRRQSALRFRVDELCRANDIEIPFPQRDLHLKSGWHRATGTSFGDDHDGA